MNIINTNLSKKDLTKLALLSGKVVHGMDFDEEDFAKYKQQFISMLDELETRYTNSELLFDARAAVMSVPTRKMDMYAMARSLVRLAREGQPSLVERMAGLPGMAAANQTVQHAAV